MSTASHTSPRRFYEIDLLRFIAAMSVVVYHLTFRGYAADQYSPLAFPAIARFSRYGYLGVELFFVISGYVILLSSVGKTLREFFVSRVARLYPAFWVACTLTFIVGRIWGTGAGDTHMAPMLHASARQFAVNMTMLQDLAGIPAIDGVYWSLTVEIMFYLLFSLLISYRLMRYIDLFIIVLLGISLLSPAPGTFISTLFFPEYAPYFAAGMLFYLIQERFEERRLMRYLLLLASYVLALRSALKISGTVSEVYQVQLSQVVTIGIVSSFFVAFWLIISRRLNLDRWKWLAIPGAITYPLYLLHSNISFIAFHRLGTTVNKYVLLVAAVLVMIAAAYLIHLLLEKRISNALKRLSSTLGS